MSFKPISNEDVCAYVNSIEKKLNSCTSRVDQEVLVESATLVLLKEILLRLPYPETGETIEFPTVVDYVFQYRFVPETKEGIPL